MKHIKSHIATLILLAPLSFLSGCKGEKKDTIYTATISGALGDVVVYGFGPDVPCILWNTGKNGSPSHLMSAVYIRKTVEGKLYLVCEGKENGTELTNHQSFFVIPKETPFPR